MSEAGRIDEFRALLFDFDWLQSKLNATNVNALLQDVARHSACDHLQSAIRLSAHILGQDKNQLAGHLIGRLKGDDSPEIQSTLSQATRWKATPWFCPKTASLTQPGGPLIRTLAGHTDWVNAVAVTPDGRRAVSASSDKTLKVWDLDRRELRTLAGHSE